MRDQLTDQEKEIMAKVRAFGEAERLVTYEGTAEIRPLIVGRHITGQSAFA